MTALNKHNDMPSELDELSRQVVDCAFAVHKELGPGFLEKIYEEALIVEFRRRGIPFECQKNLPVFYRDEKLPSEYKLDLIVAGSIVLELKAVERILPVHEAQLLSYMKQCRSPLGFVINFKEALIKNGIRRVVQSEYLRDFASSR